MQASLGRAMPRKNHEVSPYLLRPLRSREEAVLHREAASAIRTAQRDENARLVPTPRPREACQAA